MYQSTLYTFLILCCAAMTVQAQMPNYKPFLEKGEKEVSSNYVQMVSKRRSGVHTVRTFYPERLKMTMLRTYKTSSLKVLHGPYRHFNDFGVLKEAGNYQDGEKIGIWKGYNTETNQVVSEGRYEDGYKEGIHKRYYEDGSLQETVSWERGERQGAFVSYNKDGSVYNKGMYMDDEIVQQDRVEEDKKVAPVKGKYYIVEEMPRFPGCEYGDGSADEKKACADQELLKFVCKNIQYPTLARRMQVEGMVVVSFTIDEYGQVGDIETLRGVCQGMEEECVRIIKMMPKWRAGRQKGEPVRVRFNLPIRFKLN